MKYIALFFAITFQIVFVIAGIIFVSGGLVLGFKLMLAGSKLEFFGGVFVLAASLAAPATYYIATHQDSL